MKIPKLSWMVGLLVLLGSQCLRIWAQLEVQPEQIHLSYTGVITEMMVSWVTQSQVNQSVVEYGTVLVDNKMKGSSVKFTDGGKAHRVFWIHRVKLTGLEPGQRYLYHVGSELGWSNLFTFQAMRPQSPGGHGPGVRFAVYGDMGNKNAQAMSWLQEEAQLGKIDAILHVGDFAYDMDTNNSLVGDAFMRQIESVAGYVPYMTCPGNHEAAYNFSNYKNRFSMPGVSGDRMFYSFDIGPAHIISLNTEVYAKEEQSRPTIMVQYQWLEQDLKNANQANKRAAQPWIIAIGHRPMYCSNHDGPWEHCNNPANPIRLGFPLEGYPGLEDILYKYGVDLMFFAHEHSYERLWPVYNNKVCNGTTSPYTNPLGPVHIITGSAGNDEGQTGWDPVLYPWSGFHTDDFGYTRMNVFNASHLFLEQVSTDKGGVVIDKMTLVKDKHGAGLYNCHKTSDENLKFSNGI